MAANVLLLLAAVTAAWTVLSVLGGERQRRVNELEAQRTSPTAASEPPPPQAPPKAVATGKQVAR